MDHELRAKYFAELEAEKKELIDPKTGLLSKKYSQIISCPLCDAKPILQENLFIKDGYTFVRCSKCGMIFSNPQVKEELLGELYGRSKANDMWVTIQNSEKEKTWKKEYYEDCINIIKDKTPNLDHFLLDIGCSTGYFLEVLTKKENWSYLGIEPSHLAFSYAKKKELNVENIFLDQIPKHNKFNIFTMFGVLEHLPDPSSILQQIKQYAQKNSFVFIIVPNAYSLYHMFIQEKSVSFDGRNHLLYFSHETLKKLLEDNGFEIVHADTVLTGVDNIKRQIQWGDPYGNNNSAKYIPEDIRNIFENKKAEKIILDNNLGLRLRYMAKFGGANDY